MDEIDRLRRVLEAKQKFIKRLLRIVEHGSRVEEFTHLPQGAWDELEKDEFVPPHAHLMMLLEVCGWERVKHGWQKDDLYIPLWWIWAVHPQAIVWDSSKVIGMLSDSARKYPDAAKDKAWMNHIRLEDI